MHQNLIDGLGYAAGVLTTIAFIPQVWHSWTTRDLSGISLRMYGFFTLGVSLWLIYGIAVGSWPITIANGITLLLAGFVLTLKLTHKDDSP
jgi:MtN3 and saliva related transmembrane protein